MALQGPIKVSFGDTFPQGVLGIAVDALNDFDKVQAGVEDPQQRDKETGERIWVMRVIDNDPTARTSELKVKVVAPVIPVLPGAIPGTNLHPVEFDGLTVTPWVEETKTGPHSCRLQPEGHRCPGASVAGGHLAVVQVNSGCVRCRHVLQKSFGARTERVRA